MGWLTSLVTGAGLIVLAFGFFSFEGRLTRKLGALCVLAASFVLGWGLGGSVWWGLGIAGLWFLLPWVEILLRVRPKRIGLERRFERRSPPGAARFPGLGEATEEIEEEGFEWVSDLGWKDGGMEQFLRVFQSPDGTVGASLCLSEQDGLSMPYVVLGTRDRRGGLWTTTDLPFSETLKMPPHHRVQRVEVRNFRELWEDHVALLDAVGIEGEERVARSGEELVKDLEGELEAQLRHNVEMGILSRAPGAEELYRYSWRGCLFLWLRVVRDMVRL